jgi:hypothetical protein
MLGYHAQWIICLIERRAAALARGENHAARLIENKLRRTVRSMFNDDDQISYD